MIPNKTQWQKLKKQYGIPNNAVRTIKMGDAFDAYHSDLPRGFSDIEKSLGCVRQLTKTFYKYVLELKKKKDPKLKKGIDECDKIFKDLMKADKMYDLAARPGDNIKKMVEKAEKQLSRLAPDSQPGDFQQFYSQEYRAIGTALGSLLKSRNDCAKMIKRFKFYATTIDKMINGGDFSSSKLYALIRLSLEEFRKSCEKLNVW